MILSEDALPLCTTCDETLRASATRTSPGLCVPTTALTTPARDNTRDSNVDAPRLSFLRRRAPTFSSDFYNANAIESELESDEDSEDTIVDHEAPRPGSSRQVTEPPVPLPVATPSLDIHQPKHVFTSSSCPSAFAEPSSPVRAPSRYLSSPPKATERPSGPPRNVDAAYSDPDPLVDITRLRMRPKGFRCLQAGSTFKGVQKSGRSSYDVNVTLLVSTACRSTFHALHSKLTMLFVYVLPSSLTER